MYAPACRSNLSLLQCISNVFAMYVIPYSPVSVCICICSGRALLVRAVGSGVSNLMQKGLVWAQVFITVKPRTTDYTGGVRCSFCFIWIKNRFRPLCSSENKF